MTTDDWYTERAYLADMDVALTVLMTLQPSVSDATTYAHYDDLVVRLTHLTACRRCLDRAEHVCPTTP